MLTRISEQAMLDAMGKSPDYITFKDIKLVAQAQLEADQEKVQEIFEEIEKSFTAGSYQSGTYHFYSILYERWQAFKERMGVK